ncbi:MAG TPA: PDZ domain-containing protein [Firmicutes bacterium]|nr:PDZ domain-containing protein [Bacillota bacterium]
MFPWQAIGALILNLLPRLVFNPIFWVVLVLVHSQYRRINSLEQKLFGHAFSSAGKQVWRSLIYGLAGGVAGSFLLVLVGVSLTGAGVAYLWPAAMLLLLINPRFMCFAYAGGLLSLSHLIFGFPQLEIPQILSLVAVLHMVESLLIFLTGHLDPTPVIVKKPSGELVGGFNLQKFWPVPVAVMLAVALELPELPANLIRMPPWWPLLQPRQLPPGKELVYSVYMVTAALGYSDLALTCRPREKARRSAAYLALYSLALLLAAIGASFYPPLLGLAALLSPLGHELVVYLGNRREFKERAIFVPPPRGAMVLAPVPGGLGESLGLVPGEVILAVGGREVLSPAELAGSMGELAPPWELVTLKPEAGGYRKRYLTVEEEITDLGVIFVPAGNNVPYVELKNKGILQRWWQAFTGRRKGDGRA